jgi:hypothetical protein
MIARENGDDRIGAVALADEGNACGYRGRGITARRLEQHIELKPRKVREIVHHRRHQRLVGHQNQTLDAGKPDPFDGFLKQRFLVEEAEKLLGARFRGERP